MVPEGCLFATLDVAARAGKLPSGLEVIFADAVGFISDLHHNLAEALKATLEDVVEADLIIHVRDISHQETALQKDNVLKTLGSLQYDESIPIIEIWNKSDKCSTPPDILQEQADVEKGTKESASLSRFITQAHTGVGLDQLLAEVETQLVARTGQGTMTCRVPFADSEQTRYSLLLCVSLFVTAGVSHRVLRSRDAVL